MFPRLITFAVVIALLPSAAGWTKDKKSKDSEESMAAFAADAARPGDESMTCDELKKEFLSTMNDPEIKATFGQMGEQAQKDMGKMKAGAAGQMALGTAMSVASMAPGGGWVSTGAGMAQAPAQMAQAKQRQKTHEQQYAAMSAIMPKLMRGQHLLEVAQAKKCEWTKEASAGAP